MGMKPEDWDAMADRAIAAMPGPDAVSVMVRASFEHSKSIDPKPNPSDEEWLAIIKDEMDFIVSALHGAGYAIVQR